MRIENVTSVLSFETNVLDKHHLTTVTLQKIIF